MVEGLEGGDEDGHGLGLAACHDRGDRHVLDRHVLPRGTDFVPERLFRVPGAIGEHLLVPGPGRGDDGETVADVLGVEVLHDLFHVAAGLVELLLRHLDLVDDREEAVLRRAGPCPS